MAERDIKTRSQNSFDTMPRRNEYAIAKQRCQTNHERWTVPAASYSILKFCLASKELSMDHCLQIIAQPSVSAATHLPQTSPCVQKSVAAKRQRHISRKCQLRNLGTQTPVDGDKWALQVELSTFFREFKFDLRLLEVVDLGKDVKNLPSLLQRYQLINQEL